MLILLLACRASEEPGPEPYTSEIYADPASWLCADRPGDACDVDLDTTRVAPGREAPPGEGALEVVPFEAAEDPAADCFYVYPTTSLDPTPQSDLVPGVEETFVVALQAARYRRVCRVFAPMYRQVTVGGLFDGEGDWDAAYADVLDAFRHWRAHEGAGRPFVLVGHSQGSGHLAELIRNEIEPDPSLAADLVAAHLIGGFVTVPAGEDLGGTFASTPLCRERTETGCVVHYNTYRVDDPPGDDAVFAVGDGDLRTACTNPAALAGGAAELHGVYPHDVPSEVAALIGRQPGPFADEADDAVTTPYFAVPGLVDGACEEGDRGSFLGVTVDADPEDPRVDDIGGDFLPGWGLHLVDVNVAQDDLVDLAGAQIEAWSGR